MSIEEIKSLPVKLISAPNCFLFLWGTWPLLQEALDTVEAWGFSYRSIGFVWVKLNKKSPSLFWGMGNGSRSCTEFCLYAVKGKPKVQSHSVHSVVMSPVEKHSKKPDIVRDKIVELCGDVPRIELFARETVEGWLSLGFDINGENLKSSLENLF